MNELTDIYKRIEYLRNKGVKMKEMADHTNMAASVLSSLYSSVLPTYIEQVKKGIGEEDALDYALSQVNNVSKKRLLGSLKELKEQLYQLEPAQVAGQKSNPVLAMLTEEMAHSTQDAYNYSGIYMSYSLSSSMQALKAEPYLICPSENNEYVKVVHNSAYNITHYGTCLFSNHQNAYLFFNEREAPQIALFTIYLQLPMYDFPHMLKGLSLLDKKQYEEAIQEFDLANQYPANLEVAPSYRGGSEVKAYYLTGVAYEGLNQSSKAKEFFQKAADAKYPRGLSDLAYYRVKALQKLGKTAEAKAALQEMEAFLERTRTALDSYAKFGEANQNVRESNIAFYSGLVHLLKQDEKAAQADFAKALELYPGNIWAEKTK